MTLVVRSAIAVCGLMLCGGFQAASAQNDAGKGWIEGVLITDKGKPAWSSAVGNLARVTIRPKEGTGSYTDTDPAKGGFYTFRNLKPGIYEVFADKTFQKDRQDVLSYRPQHIFGLIVEPDKRTVLNITVHEGDALEQVGKPDVVSEKAIILAIELARQGKEIEEMKKQLDELKKK